MSGHSKWTQIKRQKAVTDARKGKVFSRLSKIITLAAKKGGDPEMNPALRIAIEKAKQANMPFDNIERAVKKGTGELAGAKIEEVMYEAYGPGGVALIIECATDNSNRTVSEIKHILSANGGRLGEAGSVKWMFSRLGYIEIEKKDQSASQEELGAAIIDSGAEDFNMLDDIAVVYIKTENLYKAKNNLQKNNIKISDTGFEWIAKNRIKMEDEKISGQIEKLFEELEEQEDVTGVYSNLA